MSPQSCNGTNLLQVVAQSSLVLQPHPPLDVAHRNSATVTVHSAASSKTSRCKVQGLVDGQKGQQLVPMIATPRRTQPKKWLLSRPVSKSDPRKVGSPTCPQPSNAVPLIVHGSTPSTFEAAEKLRQTAAKGHLAGEAGQSERAITSPQGHRSQQSHTSAVLPAQQPSKRDQSLQQRFRNRCTVARGLPSADQFPSCACKRPESNKLPLQRQNRTPELAGIFH